MKSLLLAAFVLPVFGAFASPNPGVDDNYKLATRIYVFKNDDVPTVAAASLQHTGNWSVFASVSTLKFGQETLILRGSKFVWTKPDSFTPSKFTLFSAPTIINRANREAEVVMGENTQYFEKLADGNFRLHTSKASERDAETAKCSLQFLIRPGAPAAEGLSIDCKTDFTTVSDREKIPGVDLDVGKPIFSSFKDNITFNTRLGDWVCLFSRAPGGGDYGFLLLIKVTVVPPGSLPSKHSPASAARLEPLPSNS